MVRSGYHVAQQIAGRLAEISEVSESVESETDVLSSSRYNLNTGEYKHLVCSLYTLTSGSTEDSYFITSSEAVGCIKRIFKSSPGRVVVEADIFAEL